MPYVIQCLRFLLLVTVCGSQLSCSLFRPRENDEETWGDPHWKFDNGSSAGSTAGQPAPGQPRLVGTSREAAYWPTTGELEARGGSLALKDEARKAPAANAGRGDAAADAEVFALLEPALPDNTNVAPGGDPLAGFWEEQDAGDSTDADIRDAEAEGDAAEEGSPELRPSPVVATADETEQGAVAAAEKSADATVAAREADPSPGMPAPIPPSTVPARGGTVVSATGFLETAPHRVDPLPEPVGAIPEVLLLDSEAGSADADAFDNVSLLADKPVMRERTGPASLLDRRRRLTLTEFGAVSDGPLFLPSIDLFESP